ncbi:hypothetical protein KAR26_03765 [Candidatus Parcubacteria bacterium]|nr:hypothetical protein [Candidatus Parcubacteria bacterium]
MGLEIKALFQIVKGFLFGKKEKTPLEKVVKKPPVGGKRKKKQTQPEIRERETLPPIKPMSGRAFLKQMNAPPAKEKRRNRCSVEEIAISEKKEDRKRNSRLTSMKKNAKIFSALAKNGIARVDRNTHLGPLRGKHIPRVIVRELKRMGINGARANINNLEVTISPAEQKQLQEIQRSL